MYNTVPKDKLQIQSDTELLAITTETKLSQNTDSPEESAVTSPQKVMDHGARPVSPSRSGTKRRMSSTTPMKSPKKSTDPAGSPISKRRLLISLSPVKAKNSKFLIIIIVIP